MKRAFVLLTAAVLAVLAIGTASVPASASVPDWDSKTASALQAQGFVVKTPAEWNAIKTEPASVLARGSWTDCPPRPPTGSAETFCLWNGYNFSGTRWNIPKSWLGDTNGVADINGLSFYGSGINNASKSWMNSTYYTVRLYDRDDCYNGTWYRDMGGNVAAVSYDASTNDWEDRISSISISAYAGNYCTNVPGA